MVQIIWHFFEFFKKGFPFLDKNGCKILCFFKDATIYAMKFCPVKKRRQKNYGRWFQPSALWSILNMSEKFIPKLIKTLINQSYKMQQDTWNTRLEASYTSLWGLPIASYSQSVNCRLTFIKTKKNPIYYEQIEEIWVMRRESWNH